MSHLTQPRVDPSEAEHARTRTARGARFWPLFVVGLLLVHVGGIVVLIVLSTGDPSVQLEENYYAKGLAWDERMAQERENLRLGWRSEVALRSLGPTKAALTVQLRQRDGRPIEAVTLTLEAFHKARAGEKLHATLDEIAPGTYTAILPTKRRGLWELRLDMRRGHEHFTQRIDRELLPFTLDGAHPTDRPSPK